jgi:hypothetical protein
MGDGVDDRIRSNGGQTYSNGVGGVVAFLDDNGLSFQPGTRGLLHEFTVCVDSPCNPPYASGTGVTQVLIRPLTADGTALAAGGLLALPLNQERIAFVKVLLSTRAENAFWTLCMDSRTTGLSGICEASAESTPVRLVRTSPSTWSLAASPTSAGGRSDVADLIKEATSGKRNTITAEGAFSLPFSMTIQCVVAGDCPAPTP